MTSKELDFELEPGLRYTEETGRRYRSLPVRDCWLWKDGIDDPVSGLNIVSFKQRFGAVSLPCEGIGGVETRPQFRRQGYMRKLVSQALIGISRRVKVVFIADAIENIYLKFGFVTCVPEAHIVLSVRNVERSGAGRESEENRAQHDFSPADLPAMIALYNQQHRLRPGTHERHDHWNRLIATQTWQPGSEVMVYKRAGELAGYAILTEQRFGSPPAKLEVQELTAADREAANGLLVQLADRCWQLRISQFTVYEPIDTVVGRAAREIGCDTMHSFPASAGMMGMIMDRLALLSDLEAEIYRRLPGNDRRTAHSAAYSALRSGALVVDNSALLRLLMGYWSFEDAVYAGTEVPEQYRRICEAWFPGGNSLALPQPYSHYLDRY